MAETLAKPGHNAGDPKTYELFLTEFFRHEDEKDFLRDRLKQDLEPLNESQARIREIVKEAGFAVAGFNHLVAEMKRDRKSKKERAALTPDIRHEVESLEVRLGSLFGTPLGDAAMDSAKEVDGNGAELLNRLTQLEPASPTPS